MRRLRPLLLTLVATAIAAHAGDAMAKKRRPPPPKPAAAAAVLRPALGPLPKLATGLGGASLPGAAFASSSLAANGFAAGGLRSGLPSVGDPAAQCRSACTASRLACDDDPATPVCAPRWAQCVATCDR